MEALAFSVRIGLLIISSFFSHSFYLQFAIYGVEYTPGEDGTATWVNNNLPAWTLTKDALAADPVSQIGKRVMAAEPMVSCMLESSLRASSIYLVRLPILHSYFSRFELEKTIP